jgi:CRISPR system Cascade subunit CasD
LGIRRDNDKAIREIAELDFGVRIDQPGVLIYDFQVAHMEEFWTTGGSDPLVSRRYYIADAVFLVGLSGKMEILSTIDVALRAPKFPVYLGRRSCPPSEELSLGVRKLELFEALCSEPWLASDWYKLKNSKRKTFENFSTIEMRYDASEGIVSRDVPLSFDQRYRRYGFRHAARHSIPVDSLPVKMVETLHDPFATLGGEL